MKSFFYYFISMIVLDFIWFSCALTLYHTELEFLKVIDNKLYLYLSAGFVYILMALAQTLFILPMYFVSNSQVLVKSILLGVIIYGVYDLTNAIFIPNWSWKIVFIDIIWGGVIFVIPNILLLLCKKIRNSLVKTVN